MKGMKGIQSVPSFIQMDDPKNGVFMCTKKLTDPFHKKYCFIFPAILVSPHIDLLHHKEIVQHWNIKEIKRIKVLLLIARLMPLNFLNACAYKT